MTIDDLIDRHIARARSLGLLPDDPAAAFRLGAKVTWLVWQEKEQRRHEEDAENCARDVESIIGASPRLAGFEWLPPGEHIDPV